MGSLFDFGIKMIGVVLCAGLLVKVLNSVVFNVFYLWQ